MIVVLGLVLLVAALVVGVAGVLTNHGGAHALPHAFSVMGYHVTGSSGTVFLYGLVVGAVAVLGLSLLLTSVHHSARLARATRRELAESRNETDVARQDRDDLIGRRNSARLETASVVRDDASANGGHIDLADRPTNKSESV